MKKTCYDCKVGLISRKKSYHYRQCGLSNVILKNIIVDECPECGKDYPQIPASASLHRGIMIELLKKNTLLSGEEIRFLRKMADLTAAELGRLMGVTATHISKWENNAKPIGPTSDRLLRLICYSGLLERMVKNRIFDVREWLGEIERLQTGAARVVMDTTRMAELSRIPEMIASEVH